MVWKALALVHPFGAYCTRFSTVYKDTAPPMASPRFAKTRYRRKGFVRASSVAKGMIRPALTKRGFAEPRILTEWDAVVGEQIGALCRPVKLGYASKQGMGGTLTVGSLGASALEVQHLTPQIIERVNAHYGYRAISRIRLVQLGAEAFERHRARATPPPSRPEDVARIRETVAPVTNEGLRGALEKLGQNIATRRPPAAQGTKQKEGTTS